MAYGVHAELDELIELRRFSQAYYSKPEGKSFQNGNYLSKVRGRGMDFAEARNYQAGDEVRHMEWRVTARTGRPHVKIYQEERERPVVILADFNPSMLFGTQEAFKSVVAARLAALLAWSTMKQGDKVGGFFFSATNHSEFSPRGREIGILPLLASLSQYTHQDINLNSQKPQMLSQALQKIRRILRPGSILILISDFYSMDNECEKHLNRLRMHNDILAYHICDPIELYPPEPAQYPITDGKETSILDTTISAVSKTYADYCLNRIDKLKKQFKPLHIQYVQTTAKTNLQKLIAQTFLRRKNG